MTFPVSIGFIIGGQPGKNKAVMKVKKFFTKAVCKKLQKDKSAEVIADELEEELSEIEKVIAAQRQADSYDIEQIYEIYSANGGLEL